jgi:hypothetical protein
MNASENYYSLIKNWHAKASDEDYFARFMFEYMAFIAYLRTQWLTEQEIKSLKGNGGKVTDRDYIQALKKDSYLNDFWTDVSLRAPKNKELDRTLNSLVNFLKKEPLKSDDRWWNFDEFDLNLKKNTRKKAGILNDKGDFQNLVEFWYSVRNNLFHGEKNPSLARDKELVRFGFLTLNFFVENILLVLKELHRVYPAIWEDFWHRFKSGEAEINTKENSRGGTGNIYECAFLEDRRYPLLLLDKQLSRLDIIKVINDELLMSGEMAEKKFARLKSVPKDAKQKKDLKKYFQNTIKVLNDSYHLKLTL